jgi:3-isopropylmalate dehydrogenase
MTKIVYLPGDGIGPEVTDVCRLVIEKVCADAGVTLQSEDHDFGGVAIDNHGDPLPASTLEACKSADAVFLGAVGGPKWDKGGPRPEAGLLGLRKALGLFANLRPVAVQPGMEHLSPLKTERVTGADILIIRELTGGMYFGEKREGDDVASDLCIYSKEEVVRVARVAFEAARKRRGLVTSIDKANVLASSRLWRKTVIALHAAEYSDVQLTHELVDAAAMKLIQAPTYYDVILTENLFGDILSDEASVIPGSIGLLGSASLGGSGPGLFEPIQGSAPDIAGQDKANPLGAVNSVSLMFRHGLDMAQAADRVDAAIAGVLKAGETTRDLGGSLTCTQVGQALLKRL